MKKFSIILLISLIFSLNASAQKIENFELNDVLTGKSFSLDNHKEKRAVVLIFTSNSCPFSRLYEDRIIALHQKYSDEFQFAIINPHIENTEEENKAAIQGRVKEKGLSMPYLSDPNQTVTRRLGASKLPEAVVITSGPTGYNVAYQGAIDNNPQAPGSVSQRYLDNALSQIVKRSSPSPASTRAVGCNIRGVN